VGRFAPSPTGDLHLGSLFTAAASYLDARAAGGRWLLRIEDLDPPRVVPGAADRILGTLERFGFEWDGQVRRQSLRSAAYETALLDLRTRGLTFECSCSRAMLGDAARYPGTCRDGARIDTGGFAQRLRVDPGEVRFLDRVQGEHREHPADTHGDLILKRRDGWYAYLLAVVVDDADQGVTDVVRGADLIEHTAAQIYLQRALELASPRYAHVPALIEPDGAKLAKSARSVALDVADARSQLCRVFALLGLDPSKDQETWPLEALWEWAIDGWNIGRVPRGMTMPVARD
jgi:glutamyl-Q tRNA(Asp) synthetase